LTIPNTIQQLGGRFYKAPMKLADQADVSAQAGGIDPVELAAMHRASADGFGPSVDFLVGAGNVYVTEAKRQPSTVAHSDKAIGTNHVLPARRAARYTGGLWVGSFLRMSTHQRIQRNAGAPVARATLAICHAEHMTGHGETARLRLEQNII
jgi:histidinol dehydrogenase